LLWPGANYFPLSFQSVPFRQRICPRKLHINQLLTFAISLFRMMVNHDCDGRHKNCELNRGMSKVPHCFAGIT